MRPRLPGRYELPELVAHGGMADVFRATDTTLGRTVAVKVLAERYARDDELRMRFAREAQTAARLTGEPNVIAIYDVGEQDGLPFIVMEYVPGGTVADRLRSGTVTQPQALDWLEQTARALDAAHAQQIVHRDVKPGNLLIGSDGRLRVSDFGIARAAAFDTLTGIGTVLGTSGYMSPEQARGQRATAASDRYALGCVAFELLTGRRPFVAESVAAEAAAHASARIPSVTETGASLPAALDDVFRRALAKEPEDRYASCAQLVAALRAALSEPPTETRVAPPPTARTALTRYRRTGRARRVGLGAGAVGLAFAGLAVAWVSTGAGDGGTATVVTTQVRTVTGDTETVTVAQPDADPPSGQESGAALNDQGFALLRDREYEQALPVLEQAVERLRGSGQIVEAWASYNLALARAALGECDGVIALLDRSEAVQGSRKEIDRLRRHVEKRCGDKERSED